MKKYYSMPTVEMQTIQPQTKILFTSRDTPEPGKAPTKAPESKTV